MKSNREKFVKKIKKEAEFHSLYLWGAQGESVRDISPNNIFAREVSEKEARRVLQSVWLRMRESEFNRARFFDCSGLVVFYLLKMGLIKNDMTADNLYKTMVIPCEKSALESGDLCFVVSGNTATHVAVYIGDGRIVDARGREYGVVNRQLTESFNAFGKLICF